MSHCRALGDLRPIEALSWWRGGGAVYKKVSGRNHWASKTFVCIATDVERVKYNLPELHEEGRAKMLRTLKVLYRMSR